jgi:tetratricopeptide (TPR) repeat protein
MGKIELRQSFGGLSGTVQVEPSLSWRDSLALERTADATRDVAGAVAMAATAVRALEHEIGLRLDAQTARLDRQIDLLADIAESLRTPARVRAAERVTSTAELLRRGRYARALEAAQQAVQDDPNNPEAFTALAWSRMGLGELELARDAFAEAVLAADGDASSQARRALARLSFAIDDAATALEALSLPVDGYSEAEQAAVRYDRAVYLAELGDPDAIQELLQAGEIDIRFFQAALDDPQINSSDVKRLAEAELGRRQRELENAYKSLVEILDDATADWDARNSVLGLLAEPGREDGVAAMLRVLEQISALQWDLDREYEQAKTSLSEFPLVELRQRAEGVRRVTGEVLSDLERRAEDERSGAARARATKALETEAMRVANESGDIPYLRKDGSWDISVRRHGRRRQIRLWLDDAGGVQRSES